VLVTIAVQSVQSVFLGAYLDHFVQPVQPTTSLCCGAERAGLRGLGYKWAVIRD